MTIASAIVAASGMVTVEGIVTTPSGLFGSARREVVIQDASAAILIRLPAGTAAPRPGSRVRITGDAGRAYGAPRIAVRGLADLGTGIMPAPRSLRLPPNAAIEWRLVRVSGTIVSVRRSGTSWRAELEVAGARLVIDGLTGSGILAAQIQIGHLATITGIVRRPYPTATDRRFSVVPRSVADVVLGRAVVDSTGIGTSRRSARPASGGRTSAIGLSQGQSGGSTTGGVPGSAGTLSGNDQTQPRSSALDGPLDIDFGDLAGRVGLTVRVGGLLVSINGDELRVDDGTGQGVVRLRGEAREALPRLTPGTALNAIGHVVEDGGLAIEVADLAGIAIVTSPGVGLGLAGTVDDGSGSSPTPLGDPGASTSLTYGETIDVADAGTTGGEVVGVASAAAASAAIQARGPRPIELLLAGLILVAGISMAMAVSRRRPSGGPMTAARQSGEPVPGKGSATTIGRLAARLGLAPRQGSRGPEPDRSVRAGSIGDLAAPRRGLAQPDPQGSRTGSDRRPLAVQRRFQARPFVSSSISSQPAANGGDHQSGPMERGV